MLETNHRRFLEEMDKIERENDTLPDAEESRIQGNEID